MTERPSDVACVSERTVDVSLGGRLRVCQPRRGYRFNFEAVALTHRAASLQPQTVIDVGAGSGVIGCGVAVLCPQSRVLLIERDPTLAGCARATIEENDLSARVELRVLDVREVAADTRSADVVVMNPPYYRPGHSRRSPNPSRAGARQQLHGEIETLCAAAVARVVDGGALVVSYPASVAVELMRAASESGFAEQRVQWIHDSPHAEASALLLTARRGRALRLRVDAPLVLRHSDGRLRAQDELWP
ncbi:MAG: tRNA1Val (adenine37-N6)-methyltransferase [Bradymonadia bacterium]